MKHLKKIDELYKSTYKSAADKLKHRHPTRSKNIMDYAEESGESELSKSEIERQWPHKFEFNNESLRDQKKHFLGKFVIVDSEKKTGLMQEYEGCVINLINDWGQKISIFLNWFKANGDYHL